MLPTFFMFDGCFYLIGIIILICVDVCCVTLNMGDMNKSLSMSKIQNGQHAH